MSWIVYQNFIDWCAQEGEDELAGINITGVEFGYLYNEQSRSGMFDQRHNSDGNVRSFLDRCDPDKAQDELDGIILSILALIPYRESNYGLVQFVQKRLENIGFTISLPTISRRMARLKSGPI